HFEQSQFHQSVATEPIFAPRCRIRSVSIIQLTQPNVASPDAATGEPNGKQIRSDVRREPDFHGAQIRTATFALESEHFPAPARQLTSSAGRTCVRPRWKGFFANALRRRAPRPLACNKSCAILESRSWIRKNPATSSMTLVARNH